MPFHEMMTRDGSEFCTIAASRGEASIVLASHGIVFLISSYESSAARDATGTRHVST